MIDFSTLTSDIPTIFSDLRYLTIILEAKSPNTIEDGDNMWFSDKMFIVQRNLNWVCLPLDTHFDHSKLDTACCMAASIYSHVYLRDLGFYSKVSQVLIRRFRGWLEGAFAEVLATALEEEELPQLFWILIIAVIPAADQTERKWFANWLEYICGEMEIKKKGEARAFLTSILWTKDWDKYLDNLWREIMG